MVWSSSQGIGQHDLLVKSKVVTGLRVYELKPFLTLGFATIEHIPGEGLRYVVDAPQGVNACLSDPEFKRLWVEEAEKMASEFRPDYLSLGNEVNDYFHFHPEDLEDYLTLVGSAYSAIKRASPNTKVLVVFSLDHLIENGQLPMIGPFNEEVDLIGFTTYPWKRYDTPEDIPDNYYSRLTANISKPIAFTEIGWPSSDSEDEQARFLSRFLELTKRMNIEMVNWLFLHDTKLSGIASLISEPETTTISLKTAGGGEKQVYHIWQSLKILNKK